MFAKIYALPISTMLCLAIFGTALWLLSGLCAKNGLIKFLQCCILGVTLYILLAATLFRAPCSERRISLIPFISFVRAKEQPEIYRSLLLNVLMFMAFSLGLAGLLPQTWKPGCRVLMVILTGLVLSISLETLQYFLALGIAETDDVIFNTLGSALAAGAMLLRDRVVRYGEKLKTKDQKNEP